MRDVTSGKARCVKAPLGDVVYLDHLRGRRPLGIYPLVEDRVWFAAIDLDEPDPEPVCELVRLGQGLGLNPLVEVSKSKGFHLWFFADDNGWPAARIRTLLRWMTAEINRPAIEVFPKQDRLGPEGFGNFIYLPLDGRLVPQSRTVFVEPSRWMPPVQDQWSALASRSRYSADHLKRITTDLDLSEQHLKHGVREIAVKQDAAAPIHDSATQRSGSGYGLPPCARRILVEGVTEQQRVACFRLAVHLWRIGVPEDLSRVLLGAWAKKNQPAGGKRVITPEEIASQTRDGYSGRYRGYGCDDPAIAQYCEGRCPVQKHKIRPPAKRVATSQRNGPLHK
ncbi:MAG: hypothetical protein AAGA29_12690 [Planctomycetota bacterium]